MMARPVCNTRVLKITDDYIHSSVYLNVLQISFVIIKAFNHQLYRTIFGYRHCRGQSVNA